jgi:hypothetical protein
VEENCRVDGWDFNPNPDVPVDSPYPWDKLVTTLESCTAVCPENGTLVDTLETYIEVRDD